MIPPFKTEIPVFEIKLFPLHDPATDNPVPEILIPEVVIYSPVVDAVTLIVPINEEFPFTKS